MYITLTVLGNLLFSLSLLLDCLFLNEDNEDAEFKNIANPSVIYFIQFQLGL